MATNCMNYMYSSWARKEAIRKKRMTQKVIFFIVLFFPLTLTAASFIPGKTIVYVRDVAPIVNVAAEPDAIRVQPQETTEDLPVKSETIREVTMYTSTPHQTDSSPCIGSSGEDQCELWEQEVNICATNAFPNGTRLHVDKLGDCVVKDAMNKRYANRIDWYAGYDTACLNGVDEGDRCPNYKRALNFGTQKLVVKVYDQHLAAR